MSTNIITTTDSTIPGSSSTSALLALLQERHGAAVSAAYGITVQEWRDGIAEALEETLAAAGRQCSAADVVAAVDAAMIDLYGVATFAAH